MYTFSALVMVDFIVCFQFYTEESCIPDHNVFIDLESFNEETILATILEINVEMLLCYQ